MKRYLIKVTYLEGPHTGDTYLLCKGGYVTEEGRIEWDDTTYVTKGIAQRECNRLKAANDTNINIERRSREWAEKRGKTFRSWNIYEAKSYEPYEVDVLDACIKLKKG